MKSKQQVYEPKDKFGDPAYFQAIARLQGWVKMRQTKKRFLKLRKDARYRKNVINELIQTELKYIQDLELIVLKIVHPLRQNETISQVDLYDIFINIPEIVQFNKKFISTIQSCFFPDKPYCVVFEKSISMIPRFDIYFEFCKKFQQSVKTQEKLNNGDQNWLNFMKQVKASNILKGSDLASYLVKPVQRLPKYVLLYKDLLKHTDKDHPDYENIKQSQDLFLEVNMENNKNMDKFMNRLHLKELDNKFFQNQNKLCDDRDRLFIFEERISILESKKAEEQPVVMYATSDSIIIAEQEQEEKQKLLKFIQLNSLSFVKNQPDSKYFSFLFMLVGQNDNVQFKAVKLESKKDLMNRLEQLITGVRELERVRAEQIQGVPAKLVFPVQVVVVGTEERDYQSFSKHTVYITEVSIGKASLKIFVRYSEIRKLCQRIKSEEFQNKYGKLDIKQDFSTSNLISNQKSKIIEERKLEIESFLQFILQSKVVKSCKEVLDYLCLPDGFYDLPEKQIQNSIKIRPSIANKQAPQQAKSFDPTQELEKLGVNIQQLKLSAGEVLSAHYLEQRLSFNKVNARTLLKSEIYIGLQQADNKNLHQVQVKLPNEATLNLFISKDTRAGEIVEKVANAINLKYYLDYRLYLVDQLHHLRLIDDDEVVYKIIIAQPKEPKGIISGFFNKVEKLLASSQQATLLIRKHIFLPLPLEEHDFKLDIVRMQLMSYGIIDLVKEEKFPLSFQDYCLYAALYFQMKFTQQVRENAFLPLSQIQDVVPAQIYKNTPEKEWFDTTKQIIKVITERLTQISVENDKKLRENKPSQYPLHTDFTKLTQMILFNSFKLHVQAGVSLYYVATHESTLSWMQQQQRKIFPNIYLGISIKKVQMFPPSSNRRNEEIGSFNFNKIKKINSFPMQIIFEFEDYKENQMMKFDTFQSYEIKNLIELYQSLRNFINDYQLDIGIQG